MLLYALYNFRLHLANCSKQAFPANIGSVQFNFSPVVPQPEASDKNITMSTILRLRGLDTKASAEDIRSFFGDFQIPDGGVFIVGGAFGEAFIAFHSDEDGSLALQLNGQFLKDSQVDLHISSMLEAEHKFDSFLKRKKSSSKPSAKKQDRSTSNGKALTVNVTPVDPRAAGHKPSDTVHLPVGTTEETLKIDSLDTNAAFLLGVCTLLQGLPSSQANVATGESPIEPSSPDPPIEAIPGYIRVFGLPFSTTKQDICHFFKGLNVQEVMMNIQLGAGYGSLVKFGSFQDATDALSFNNCSLGSACVEVRTATEKMWLNALQEREDVCQEEFKLKQGPLKDTLNYKKDSGWPRKRQYSEDSLHKSSKKLTTNGQPMATDAPSDNRQHIIMVSNLPVTITKTEIKELFGCPNIAHTNVQHLLDPYKNRTDRAFIMFNKREDYDYAINLSGCHVGSHTIDVTPMTKEEMRSMMAKDKSPSQNTRVKKPQKIGRTETTDKEEQSRELCSTARTCVYVRNMPANVRRSQIRALFSENKLREEDITLLHDRDGACIGEAVVRFQSQTNAALALMHHGMEFLGSKLLLTPINVKQMENILTNDRY